MDKDGAGFFVYAKAEKHRNTWCIPSFDNKVIGRKDKPDCSDEFLTVPQYTKEKSRFCYHQSPEQQETLAAVDAMITQIATCWAAAIAIADAVETACAFCAES